MSPVRTASKPMALRNTAPTTTAMADARRPAHYLAIPQSLFSTAIGNRGAAGLSRNARVIVEKPFGRDLASARELNRVAQSVA